MNTWLKGIFTAAITGAANAVLLVIIAPQAFSLNDLETLGLAAFAMSLVNVAAYLKQSPLPK